MGLEAGPGGEIPIESGVGSGASPSPLLLLMHLIGQAREGMLGGGGLAEMENLQLGVAPDVGPGGIAKGIARVSPHAGMTSRQFRRHLARAPSPEEFRGGLRPIDHTRNPFPNLIGTTAVGTPVALGILEALGEIQLRQAFADRFLTQGGVMEDLDPRR
jgi:hypothetical protein